MPTSLSDVGNFFGEFLPVLGGKSLGAAGRYEVFHSFVGGGVVIYFFTGVLAVDRPKGNFDFGSDKF